MLKAKAQFKRRSTANNVEISIPVPEDADTPRFRTNIGSVHYAPEQSAIVWKIKQFGGGKEFLMRAELGLPSVRGDDEKGGGMMGGFGGSMGGVGDRGKGKRPINVKFEVCLVSLVLLLPLADASPDPILYYIRHQRQISQDHRTKGKRRPTTLQANADSIQQLQYPSLPWVRYITQSGDIAVRLPDTQS
jgi:AP-1 complex subunit mu